MDTSVTWSHDLTFTGTANTGFHVPLGASPGEGSAREGFSPLELLLVGLAGCTAMDVISILHKKQEDVTAFEVKAHADRAADHPKVFTTITVEYVVRGRGVDPASVERAIELSETKYCSASAMLSKAAPIRHTFQILEESAVTHPVA